MKRMNNISMRNIVFAILVLYATGVKAQEVLSGFNPNLPSKASSQNLRINNEKSESLTLPFIDDFSDTKNFPNEDKWKDSYVYINSTLPFNPYTIGVATFDIVDDEGEIYENAMASAFDADVLTSKPIRLDSVFDPTPKKLTVNDSIYFSFLYQQGGIGNLPEINDSLMLEFFAGYSYPNDSTIEEKWINVWSAAGIANDTSVVNDSSFNFVMIRVDDTAFLKEDFKFRFRNKASINSNIPSWASNSDFWHVDFIYLDHHRKPTSVFTYPELSFANNAPSFLKKYQAMPYRHFKFSKNKPNLVKNNPPAFVNLNNLDLQNQSAEVYYEIRVKDELIYTTQNNAVFPIPPYINMGFNSYPSIVSVFHDLFEYPAIDSVVFSIRHIIREENTGQVNFIRSNDTIQFDQIFTNYFAYDDGSPETGYGLTPRGSILAYEFNPEIKDTLRGVDIFFNKTKGNANEQYFDLMIYKDELSSDNLIYKSADELTAFEDGFNNFHRYYFIDTLFLNEGDNIIDGKFYIALKQQSDAIMNIGYDLNNDAGNKTFYNVSGDWQQSIYNGALMIRPIVGKTLSGSSRVLPETPVLSGLKTYPNPCSTGILKVEFKTFDPRADYSNIITLNIYDNIGRKVLETNYSKEINVSHFQNGIYFIKAINTESGEQFSTKVLIAK